MHQQTTLPNGLLVVSSHVPHARSVSTSLFITAGSRFEPDETQGVSHFIEHMFFKGTDRRPTAKEISESIEGIGGYINAETGKEAVVYWDKVTRDNWLLALDVIADITLNSRFESHEVEKERKVITEELSTLFDNPGEWVHILSDETIWGAHPLGRDVGGTIASVGQLTRDQMLEFCRRRYVPANAVISIAGSIEHQEAVDAVSQVFGGWAADSTHHLPTGPDPASADRLDGIAPPAALSGLAVRAKRTEQTHLCIATPAVSYVHPDRYTLEMLNIILGSGMSSRLFLEIRERQGLAYDVHSALSQYRDSGSLVIYAGVDPKQADATIAACLEQARILGRVPADADELGRAKEFWKGRTLLGMENTTNVGWWYGNQALLVGEIMEVDEALARIEAVTAEEVRALAESLFAPERLCLALVGPRRGERRLADLLWRSRPAKAS